MNVLKALNDYSNFIIKLLDRSGVEKTTVVVWSESRYTGVAEGEVYFISTPNNPCTRT